MLKRLEVQNFLALKNIAIDLEPFTVLVGPNASGKSTILEALHRVCALKTMGARVLIDGVDFGDVAGKPEGLRFSRGHSFDIIWKIDGTEVGIEKGEDGWMFSLQNREDQIGTAAPLYEVSDSIIEYFMKGKEYARVGFDDNADAYDINVFWELTERFPKTINLHLNAQKMASPSYMSIPSVEISSDGMGLASACANLSLEFPDTFQRVQELLRLVIPSVKRFRIKRIPVGAKNWVGGEPDSYDPKQRWAGDELLFDFEDAENVPAKYVSEGTLITLGILVASAQFQGEGLVLLDDLERGLHPKAVHDLMNTLRKLQEVNPNLQIVATTHSPYVLDEVKAHEVRVVTRDAEHGTVVGRLDEHPKFEEWKSAMLPGEFWSHVGEDWLLKKTEHAK